MNRKRIFRNIPALLLLSVAFAAAQPRNYDVPPMMMDVGNFSLSMNKLMGEGQLQTQFSWMLIGNNPQTTEILYWPADRWYSNMLYQIFNPIVLDSNGIINAQGVKCAMYIGAGNDALINSGKTDWCREIRRYRPPHIVVDGIQLDPPYAWNVDPTIKSDIKLEWEDVLNQFGIRSHLEMYAFSNPNHADYFIWKATHKFTGELKVPREASASTDTIPDQTIGFWWPIAFSFGPSKAGEYLVNGSFFFEGSDDLDSWFKIKSQMATRTRDSLYIAYYWDSKGASTTSYPNGSKDDTGDPDRVTGFLTSTAVCGYTLLHADQSAFAQTDDLNQPYAMPHAGIYVDLWGRRDVGLLKTYRGDDSRGRFPLDPITAGLLTKPDYGPMRFITTGPYQLTKNKAQGRYDSITFVYSVGVGSIPWSYADSIGRGWINKTITDSAKDAWVLRGRDSLANVLDRANWAWKRLSTGLSVPAAPAPPDVSVTSGPGRITVAWSYPDPSYFKDAVTGVDDWYAWRVYRKKGAYLVRDPLDLKSSDKWEQEYETRDRSQLTYIDTTVQRGVDYYYAVTAVDNGSQTLSIGDDPQRGQKLESSRMATRSQLPATTTGIGNKASIATTWTLFQNYPNPFNPSTAIRYGLPNRSSVRLVITNTLGQEVAVLTNGEQEAGYHKIEWHANVASGIYFYRIEAVSMTDPNNRFVQVKKMLLLK